MSHDYAGKLTAFLNDELLSRDASELLGPNDDLLTTGLLDSIAVMRLVAFIESDLGVNVPPEDVTFENFLTVTALASYLETQGEAVP
ncbi:MAG: phosphopantetheine-binding protein [Pseudomonadota bacterium]